MKRIIVNLLSLSFFMLSFISCGDKHTEAKEYLQTIKQLYESGNYDIAKQKIDSIQILYPKSFDQIKEGMSLLQNVRRAQDVQQIAFCDSAISALQPKIDSVKQYFVYNRNKEYEETGRYLPKATSSSVLTGTLLRSGVNENGTMYIESVYIGGQYHDQVHVSIKDGSFAETKAVTDEGVNFRFTDMGKQYEVVKFAKDDENGVSRFIFSYADQPLKITLKGKNTTSYTLSNTAKKAIVNSFQLSSLMLEADSLNNVKEIAQKRIEYLDSKNDTLSE